MGLIIQIVYKLDYGEIKEVFNKGFSWVKEAFKKLTTNPTFFKKTNTINTTSPKEDKMGSWCFYDIPNENVIFLEDDYQQPTDEELARNVIKMPLEQAKLIRHAKGLPMPSPPVNVIVYDDEGNVTYDSTKPEEEDE